MSSTTSRNRADQTNLSPSRIIDGASADAAAIPAVDPHTDPCSDSVDDVANHSSIAPRAHAPLKGLSIMNHIVSTAAIATATAVPNHVAAKAPASIEARSAKAEHAPSTIDPIFAAIEAHRQAYAAVKTATGCDDETFRPLSDREMAAAKDLAETVPSTLKGLLAMLEYLDVAIVEEQRNSDSSDGFEMLFGGEITIFATLAKAAKAFRGARESSAQEQRVIDAGSKFEALLPQYLDTYFEWTALRRASRAEAEAKFGPWSRSGFERSPAFKMHEQLCRENGADAAEMKMSKLGKKLDALGHEIRVDVTTIAGLRAQVLLMIWDSLPPNAGHEGCFEFSDHETTWALLQGAAEVAGLHDLLTDVWTRLAKVAA
jgi:hypothetical protein